MIVDWFLGSQGQHAIVDGWMHSVRKDFGRSPFGSIPLASIQANSMPFSWENSLRDRGEILRRFEEQAIGRR
jgi:iron(III) transport system substrate-binding protein